MAEIIKPGEDFGDRIEQLEARFSFASNDIFYFNAHRPTELVHRLQNRFQGFDASIVPDLFLSAIGERVQNYQMSKSFGTGHVIVFVRTQSGRDLVLRANHALAEPEIYMGMEAEVITRYEKAGVPSVEIIASDVTRKHFAFDYQIMKPLDGKDLESDWSGSKADYDAISRQLGRMIARQYQIRSQGWGRWTRNQQGEIVGAKNSHHDYLVSYLDHDLEVLKLFGFLSENSTDQIMDFFYSRFLKDLFKDTRQGYFVHHDIADHNIRYRHGKVPRLYDWENAVVFDPISDLGSAPTWKTHHERESWLVKGFVEELGYKPDNLEAKMAVYFLRTMIWKVQFALKGKRLNARHIDLTRDALRRNGLKLSVSSDHVA